MSERLHQLNAEMRDLKDRLLENESIENQIRSTQNTITRLENDKTMKLSQLKREEEDVERLQKLSWMNVYHTLINDKKEALTKEEQEVLEVKAELDQVIYNIEENEKHLLMLQSKKDNTRMLQNDYDQLMARKRAVIQAELPSEWEVLEKLEEEESAYQRELKEVVEAIHAGDNLLMGISGIRKSLKSAKGWGTYDMLGGGLIATMAKRGHMEDAQVMIRGLQHTITRFNQELQDVSEEMDVDLSMDNFLGFADWFFDGFFVDMMVQNKINDATIRVENLESRVEQIMADLKSRERRLNDGINTNRRQYDSRIAQL